MKKLTYLNFTLGLTAFLFCSFFVFGKTTVSHKESFLVDSDPILEKDIRILHVGDYMKGELDTDLLDRQWYGLFDNGRNTYVKKVKLKKSKLKPDIQYDWEWSISVDSEDKCITLISGIELEEIDLGRSMTRFQIGLGELQDLDYLEASLTVEGEKAENHQSKNFKVTLESYVGEKRETQVLFSEDKVFQTTILLEWAGDIDGDGKVDLLMEIPGKEIGYHQGFFLSSEAEEGDIVKLVADWYDGKC